jgi:hypothetical protein
MQVRAPVSEEAWEIDWDVADGAEVAAGTRLGWLGAVGHCAWVPLLSPCAGKVARRTSLLPLASPGALVAVVGEEAAALREEERALLAERRRAVEAELAAVLARGAAGGAARALLADDERRLRAWLQAATAP